MQNQNFENNQIPNVPNVPNEPNAAPFPAYDPNAAYPAAIPTPEQSAIASEYNAKGKRKKKGLIITLSIIAAVIVSIAVIGIIGDNLGGDNDNNPTLITEDMRPAAEHNPEEYANIFGDTGIVHSETFVGMGTETESYAKRNDYGRIECVDFAHVNGAVKQYIETVYEPCFGASEESIEAYINDCKAELAKYEKYDFITVTYDVSDEYVTVKTRYKELDKKENLKALFELGIMDVEADVMSMLASENNILKEGYIKK